MKHAKITSLEALEERTLSVLLREALALNRKEGDPTRR